MKIKINWGTGIAIAIALFIVFILSFVYKTIFIEKYEHHLVSEDYYKDELHYHELIQFTYIPHGNVRIRPAVVASSSDMKHDASRLHTYRNPRWAF